MIKLYKTIKMKNTIFIIAAILFLIFISTGIICLIISIFNYVAIIALISQLSLACSILMLFIIGSANDKNN